MGEVEVGFMGWDVFLVSWKEFIFGLKVLGFFGFFGFKRLTFFFLGFFEDGVVAMGELSFEMGWIEEERYGFRGGGYMEMEVEIGG